MSAWPFIAYSVVFLALVCVHFLLAYRAWRVSRGEQSSDIDPNYVRMEDYFARSFRLKVMEWLKLPVQTSTPDGTRIIRKGRENIRVSDSAAWPSGSKSDDIQVVRGTFLCGTECVLSREIYARESAFVGADSRLQAIAVDGDLTIDAGVNIARWADSTGEMEIGPGSVVRARATSGKSIRLGERAQVGSVFAPMVSTSITNLEDPEAAEDPKTTMLQVPASVGEVGSGRLGLDPKRLRPIGAECLMYQGDLKPSVPFRLTMKLIVKGDCIIPEGSVLEGDLKAHGRIVIGNSSICKGNVVGSGDIRFGSGSRFFGVVHAGKTLLLCRNVRGGAKGAFVAAFAADELLLEDDVTVYGKLAAGRCVIVSERKTPNRL